MSETIRELTVRINLQQGRAGLKTPPLKPALDDVDKLKKKNEEVAVGAKKAGEVMETANLRAAVSFAKAADAGLGLVKAFVLLNGANEKSTIEWIKQIAAVEGTIIAFRSLGKGILDLRHGYKALGDATKFSGVGSLGGITGAGLLGAAASPAALAAAAVAFAPHVIMLKQMVDLKAKAAEQDERSNRLLEIRKGRREEELDAARRALDVEEKKLRTMQQQDQAVRRLHDKIKESVAGQLQAGASAEEKLSQMSPGERALAISRLRTDPQKLGHEALVENVRQFGDERSRQELLNRVPTGQRSLVSGVAGEGEKGKQQRAGVIDTVAGVITSMITGGAAEASAQAVKMQTKAVENATKKQDELIVALDRLKDAIVGANKTPENVGGGAKPKIQLEFAGPLGAGGAISRREANELRDFAGNAR